MGTFSPLTTHYYLYFVQFIARTKTILPPILLTVSCVFVCGAVPMWVVLSSASVLGLFEYKILGWDLAIARYQPRPCGQQGGLRLHLFFGKIFVIGIFGEFFKKQFWWKYFFNNIFGATYFENIFGENIFGAIFFENIFGENIIVAICFWKYFWWKYFFQKYFWHKYFLGKGTSLSLLHPRPTIPPT